LARSSGTAARVGRPLVAAALHTSHRE